MSTTVENRLQSPQAARLPRAGAVKNRRRPALAAFAALLIALGGVGAWVAFSLLSDRVQVVTVVADVPAGTQISENHLGQARVALEPGVRSVPVADKNEVVGQRAKVALTAGSLLTRGQVTGEQLMKSGEQVIPVRLKPALVPASSLSPVQELQIMPVPGPDGADEPSKGSGEDQAAVVEAHVVKLGEAPVCSTARFADTAIVPLFVWSASTASTVKGCSTSSWPPDSLTSCAVRNRVPPTPPWRERMIPSLALVIGAAVSRGSWAK